MKKLTTLLVFSVLSLVTFAQNTIVKFDKTKITEFTSFCVQNNFPVKQTYNMLDMCVLDADYKSVKRKSKKCSAILIVEEDKTTVQTLDFIPNDSNFGTQWYLRQFNDKDIDADEAYDIIPNNAPVTVAMFDGGLDMTHPDLVGNIDYAFNAVTNQIYNGAFVNDLDRHGTACSGTIAAVTNNLTGVASLGFNKVKVMPINIMSTTNGSSFSTSTQIQLNAINAAMANPNCAAIAMSYSSNSYSAILDAAFTQAKTTARNNKGLFLCASSANNNNPNATNYPANYSAVYGIGATSQSDVRSGFSNYGNIVDISAPGSSIPTTDRSGTTGYSSGDYATVSGTSFSCPITATAGALLVYKNPDLTESDVMSILANSADKVGNYIYDFNPNYPFSTRSIEIGYGRINIYNALLATPESGNPPPPPTPIHNIVLGNCSVNKLNPELTETVIFTATQSTTQPQNEAVESVIQIRLSNDGTWSADDIILKTDTVTLGNGIASAISTVEYTVNSYGTKFFLARADFAETIVEPTELDNSCGASFNVILIPQSVDLAVEIIGTPWSGCSNTPQPQFRYRFRNVGTEPINSFSWRLSWLNGVPSTQVNNFSSTQYGLNTLQPGAVSPTFTHGFNYTIFPEGITVTRMVELFNISPTDLNELNNSNFNTYTRNCNSGNSDSVEEENPIIKVVATNLQNLKDVHEYNNMDEAMKNISGFFALHIYRKDESVEIIKIMK